MSSNKKIILGLIILILLVSGILYFDNQSSFNYENLREFIDSHSLLGPLLFILIFTVSVVFLLPASVLSILAGVLFGSFFGFIYTMIGIMLGATISFSIARYFGRDFVEKFTKDKNINLDEYDKMISRNGFLAVLFTRLTPLVPFKIPNYIFGLTKIKKWHYMSATFLGMIPESFLLVYFGEAVLSLSIWKIILIVLLMIVIFGVAWWSKRFWIVK